MAKATSKSVAAIQRLLAERREVERWLERLEMAADKTPEPVRERVRADYRKRLSDVLGELRGYTEDLSEALRRHRENREGLAEREGQAAERLAEAELRHAVGEYDESKWRELHSDVQTALGTAREDLKRVDEEIGRLEEVMVLVEGKKAAPTSRAAPARASEEIPPPPRRASASVPSPPPVGASPPSRGHPQEEPAPSTSQTNAFDELAFLKSVTEDDTHGPAASRASGSYKTADYSSGGGRGGGKAGGGLDVGAEGVGSGQSVTHEKGSGSTEKTLKCGDCSALNLPTEWYCERCGAELAAL